MKWMDGWMEKEKRDRERERGERENTMQNTASINHKTCLKTIGFISLCVLVGANKNFNWVRWIEHWMFLCIWYESKVFLVLRREVEYLHPALVHTVSVSHCIFNRCQVYTIHLNWPNKRKCSAVNFGQKPMKHPIKCMCIQHNTVPVAIHLGSYRCSH